MLLRPIPFHTRSTSRNADGVTQVWLNEKQVLDMFGGVWRETTPLEDCQVLEIIVLPKDWQRGERLPLEEYAGFSSEYAEDLDVDPSVHIALISGDNGAKCVIYRIGPQAHEYWYCDVEVSNASWIIDWLGYAGSNNLYYYGCGEGANALFYHPHDPMGFREKFAYSFRDVDLGYYEPSWEMLPDGWYGRSFGPLHTMMQDGSQGERIETSKDSDGITYRVRQRARPTFCIDQKSSHKEISGLSNILHRNDYINVLLCFDEGFLRVWDELRMGQTLQSLNWDISKVTWRGTTWYLVTVPEPLYVEVVLRSTLPLPLEQVVDATLRFHTEELIDKLTSKDRKPWVAEKKFIAVTEAAMAQGPVEELLNYQPLREQQALFGNVWVGIRVPDYSAARTTFEKPLTLIPPETDITIEFTTNRQESDWFKHNLGGDSDNLEDFNKRVRKHLSPDLPPLKFIRPGQLDLGKMADELSAAYGAPRDNVQRMLDIWVQYVNQNPDFPPRQGSFDRTGPTSAGWNPDGVFDDQGRLDMYEIAAKAKRFQGRDVLVHRETGVKVYVIRRRYGMVTLQSEAGQEFVLNNDIVETVYDKESK